MMVDRLFRIAFLLLFPSFLMARTAATPSPEQIAYAERFASFVVSIENEHASEFYGSGWITHVDHQRAFVVFPFHILPKTLAGIAKLKATTFLAGSQPIPFQWINAAPGYDLAMGSFSIALLSAKQRETLSEIPQILRSLTVEIPKQASQLKTALVGVPGYWSDNSLPRIAFVGGNNHNGFKITDLNDSWVIPFNTGHIAIADLSFSDSRTKLTEHCPQLFVETCIEAQLAENGFSGGAFLVKGLSDQQEATNLAGMVTHFSPLAMANYIIPAATVIKVAERLFSHPSSEPKLEPRLEIDEQERGGLFRLVRNDTVQILKGSLQGKVVTARAMELAPGGGEFRRRRRELGGRRRDLWPFPKRYLW